MASNGLLPCVALVLVVTAAGCGPQSYNVRTNKDLAYSVPLTRVLLVSTPAAVAAQPAAVNAAVEKFERTLLEEMKRHFDAACIPTAMARANGAAPGQEDAVRKAISAFSPTQVLELHMHSMGYVERYQTKLPQGGWSAALTDTSQNRVVWRAEASSAVLFDRNSRALADEFVQKLRSEGLLADACRGGPAPPA